MILSLLRPGLWAVPVLWFAAVTRSLPAQSAADTLAFGRAVGESLRPDARTIVSTTSCDDPGRSCTAVDADSSRLNGLVHEIARAAGARVASHTDSVPPCPWGYDPARAGAGYVVQVSIVRWVPQARTATVLVRSACDNPPGYTHDIFYRADDYTFEHAGNKAWRLLTKRLRWIT